MLLLLPQPRRRRRRPWRKTREGSMGSTSRRVMRSLADQGSGRPGPSYQGTNAGTNEL